MIFNKTYSLKVSQEVDILYENIRSKKIDENINNLPYYEIYNNIYIKGNPLEGVFEETVYTNKDICAQYVDKSSVKGLSVPSNNDFKYLLKDSSGGYSFTYKKPYPNILIDNYQLLYLNNRALDFERFGEMFDKVQYSTKLKAVHKQSSEDDVWEIFSFSFGGISKADNLFFSINSNNTITILEENENIIIDYIEGLLYINSSLNIERVAGIFNVEPIEIFKEGCINLLDNNSTSDFYKLQNRSDREGINLDFISNQEFILSFDKNCYIVSTSPDTVCIDGVNCNKPTYIKKDALLYVTAATDESIDNYLESTENLFENLYKYNYPNNTFIFNNYNIISDISSFNNNGLLIFFELESNTFSNQPYFIPLGEVNIE